MSQDHEIIEATSRPLAVRGEAVDEAPRGENLALFGTSDPLDVIARATRVADALKAMIVKKKLITNIQGKEYPQVEAWQTLAVMLGLAAVLEWSRPVEDGWEARVIVQRNGVTIAAAEAQCLKTEKSKRSWEDYAIRSMAQTRATSKSLRSVLGFVMTLAGYEATPAEEMPNPAATAAPPKAAPTESAEAMERRRADGIKRIHAWCTEKGIDSREADGFYKFVLRDTFRELFDGKTDDEVTSTVLTLPQLQEFSRQLTTRHKRAQNEIIEGEV